MMEVFTTLENSGLATSLRESFWIYPLVNATHILGVALLVGAILPMDLRLLGTWPAIPVATLGGVLLPFAVAGLLLAIVSGSLLFTVQAKDYVVQPLFWAKMGLLVLGLANALALRGSVAWAEQFPATSLRPAVRLKIGAMVSFLVWLAVLLLGRLLGYL